ncbi:hypothetical protein PILCRDRAFT_329826 [Piloderma croceum F 1598]|uniref:Uncharacterized protein n=1 Tax=Piloderma croceum (strain F 1598) TaxID=765440 RepID=A0A0C3G267_PILCF|nr:hypothetical protein PILCRDRAFT_329826 [Piloderma croceum F 1598]
MVRRAPISDCSSLSATCPCHLRLTSWKPPTWKIIGREVSSHKAEALQPSEYNPWLTVSDLVKALFNPPAWHMCSRRFPEQIAGMQSNQPHLRIKGQRVAVRLRRALDAAVAEMPWPTGRFQHYHTCQVITGSPWQDCCKFALFNSAWSLSIHVTRESRAERLVVDSIKSLLLLVRSLFQYGRIGVSSNSFMSIVCTFPPEPFLTTERHA